MARTHQQTRLHPEHGLHSRKSSLPIHRSQLTLQIWISPITQQISGNTPAGAAFHGYWQNNINALNANFGSAADLQALSAAVHKRGMYLMVDIVVNHFAWTGAANTVDYSTFVPFNTPADFHPYCPITSADYASNQTAVEQCWLGTSNVELVDVNTENPDVVNTLYSWINNLVTTYSIDGLRIDTAKHISKAFWPGFTTASGVYTVGEVFDGNPAYTCPYQSVLPGVLNYPLYYPLTSAFSSTSGSMPNLVSNLASIASQCADPTLLANVLENHDQPRFPSLTSDLAAAQNAIAFTILGTDGIPIIYEGQEQHLNGGPDPYNREAMWLSNYNTAGPLYSFIGKVNQIRNQAIYKDPGYLTARSSVIYSDTTTIATRKGNPGAQIVGVFSNKGSYGASYSQRIPMTGFAPYSQVVEIIACGPVATVDGGGGITVAMGQGKAKIYYPLAQVVGSGICGH
jgi:alpha-amylase